VFSTSPYKESEVKRILVFICYALTPVPAIVLYLASLGSWQGAYSVSVILGVTAFTLLCDQFILASRPAFVVEALGLKKLLSFHASMPIPILLVAFVHRTIKFAVGFEDSGAQAELGGAAFWIFLVAILLALFLMANTFLMRTNAVKALRDGVYSKTGLDYKKMRFLHNLTVAAALVLIVHVLLASSSSFAGNPAGASWMIVWLAFSLGLYARYKLRGRKA
jgi:predicted ferric reductase